MVDTSNLIQPTHEGRVELRDRRRLGYAVFGTGQSTVVWLHGTPGGRRQIPPAARALAGSGSVRVIGIERPGIGESTPHLHGEIRDFAADVDAVLAALGVERCAVVGLSGGGPYALACAHELERVETAAVLGGVAPTRGPEAIGGGVSRLTPLAPAVEALHAPLGTALSLTIRAAHPLASPAFDLFMRMSRPGDREVFAAPGMKQMFLDDMLRGTRSGLRSLIYDYLLFSREWGFRLADIAKPVHFWHGDDDPFVPLAHGRHQAELVPDATLTLQPGHSHLGGLAAAEEVLARVLAELRGEDNQAQGHGP